VFIEATAGLDQAWWRELNHAFPDRCGYLRRRRPPPPGPSWGRDGFEPDDRDCAALTNPARQGQRRRVPDRAPDALAAAVRHRRGLIAEHKVALQRLHDQLHALCPGLAAPDGHGAEDRQRDRADGAGPRRRLRRPATFTAVAADSSPRPRVGLRGRVLNRPLANLPAPPADAQARAARLGRSMARGRASTADIADWASHDVRLHQTGTKRFRHPVVGDLPVGISAMDLPADHGLTLTAYTAEPSSETAEKPALLAS
jgi:hypothetical protein